MAIIRIQVESASGRIFSKDMVELYQMPREGERLQLGPLVGVTELQDSSVEVKSVVHRITAKGGVIPPIVILNMSEVSGPIMDKIRTYWEEFHPYDTV
jgi:hypothetical protein